MKRALFIRLVGLAGAAPAWLAAHAAVNVIARTEKISAVDPAFMKAVLALTAVGPM